MTRTALYRHFGEGGKLLYIGISLSQASRLSQHKTASAWFQDITNVSVEWFDSRDEAILAEAAAIKSESPMFNKVHHLARVKKPREKFVGETVYVEWDDVPMTFMWFMEDIDGFAPTIFLNRRFPDTAQLEWANAHLDRLRAEPENAGKRFVLRRPKNLQVNERYEFWTKCLKRHKRGEKFDVGEEVRAFIEARENHLNERMAEMAKTKKKKSA